MFTCFGYGSLVNANTLAPGTRGVRVRVTGWRRAWRHSGLTAFGRRCTLTVYRDCDSAIDGVVIAQPVDTLAALDRREGQYTRHALDAGELEWLDAPPDGWPAPFLYVGNAEHCRPGDADHPIMLSYLDVVIAGFLRTFGASGADHFLQTTDDWHVPVLNDRAAPRYPRALSLSSSERQRVDRCLEELAIVPIQASSQPSSVSATR
jgi:cation transport protein ChaC